MRSPFGFVIIDKPSGLTSHDCVSRLRKIFGIKRIGHGGTLDPAVTGVLPVALGHATRLLRYLPGEKTYLATIQLGQRSSTDDLTGEIVGIKQWPQLNRISLEKYLDQFRGRIKQQPPQISSVHFQGERAYKRVLRGEVLNLPERNIIIHELLLLNWEESTGQLELKVHCTSGTYIRALARDLGEILGCGGCLAKLRRIQALGFHECQAEPLPEKTQHKPTPTPTVLKPIKALQHLPQIELTTEVELNYWRKGRPINISKERYKQPAIPSLPQTERFESSIVIIDCNGEVAGIATWKPPSTLHPKVVFNAHG